MDKLSFQVVADVVVAKELVLSQLESELIPIPFNYRLLELMKADSDIAAQDEVHLKDLLFFIIEEKNTQEAVDA